MEVVYLFVACEAWLILLMFTFAALFGKESGASTLKCNTVSKKRNFFETRFDLAQTGAPFFPCSGTDSVLKVYRRSRTFDSLKSDAQSKLAILFLALCMSGPSVLHFMTRKTVKQESTAIFLPWKLKMLSLCNHHLQEAYSSQGCGEPCMNCVRLDWAPVDKHDWSFALNVFCIGAQPRRKKMSFSGKAWTLSEQFGLK